LGFDVGESLGAMRVNFDTFADLFSEESLDKKAMMEVRKTREIIAQACKK